MNFVIWYEILNQVNITSTMHQDRLERVAMLSIEQEVTKQINLNDIVEELPIKKGLYEIGMKNIMFMYILLRTCHCLEEDNSRWRLPKLVFDFVLFLETVESF